MLVLKKERTERQVRGFSARASRMGLRLFQSRSRQDAVESAGPRRPTERRATLEPGELQNWKLVREAALAKFSLLNAHLEKHRKEVGILENQPGFNSGAHLHGLNIGAGLVLFPFPLVKPHGWDTTRPSHPGSFPGSNGEGNA